MDTCTMNSRRARVLQASKVGDVMPRCRIYPSHVRRSRCLSPRASLGTPPLLAATPHRWSPAERGRNAGRDKPDISPVV